MDRSIVLIAHNIRSLWNVGSFFRTADAFGVQKVYLTGYTATPPRREISKTALGAEEWIPWESIIDPSECINTLKQEGYTIVGLEQAEGSVDVASYRAPEKVALIVGHEVTGIPDSLLALCEDVIEIPMHGKKESINVSVAAGIALYNLRNG